MSEASSGEDITLKCLTLVLNNGIGTDPAKAEALALLLRDDDIIKTRNERRALVQLAKDGRSVDAIQQMITAVTASGQGIQYFVTALEDEDLKIDKRFSEILALVLDEKSSNETKIKVVALWDELVSFQQDVKAVIDDLWPDEAGLTTDSWPLGFIHFCVTARGENLQKVENFMTSATFLSPQNVNVEKPSVDPEKLDFHEPPIEDVSGESGSFVILNEDGEEGNGEHSLASQQSVSTQPNQRDPESQVAAGNEGGKAADDPMLSSTGSQDILKKLEDASNVDHASPASSILHEPPNIYVSEDSSLSTSAPSVPKHSGEDDAMRPQNTASPASSILHEPPNIYVSEDSSLSTSAPSVPKHSVEDDAMRSHNTDDAELKTTNQLLNPAGAEEGQGDARDASVEPVADSKPISANESLDDDGDQDPVTTTPTPRSRKSGTLQNSENADERDSNDPGLAGASDSDDFHSADETPETEPNRRTLEDNADVERRVEEVKHLQTGPPTTPFASFQESGDEQEWDDDEGSWEDGGADGGVVEATESLSSTIARSFGPGYFDPSRIVSPPVVGETTASDGELADQMNLAVAVEQSSQSARSSSAPTSLLGTGSTLNVTHPPRLYSTTNVEFRVIFAKGEEKIKQGVAPCLQYNRKGYRMARSQAGYYSVTLQIQDASKIRYRYALSSKSEHRVEYLPKGKQVYRVLELGSARYIVVLDVSCVTKLTNELIWETMMNTHMREFLPKPSSLATPTALFSGVNEVYLWLANARNGWRTNTNYFYKCSHQNIEQSLRDWLGSVKAQPGKNFRNVFELVLCSLAVVSGVYRTAHGIQNVQLLSSICNGLHIHQVDGDAQSLIFEMLTKSGFHDKALIRNGLQFFFKQLIGHGGFSEPSCIMAIPLYWLACNDGVLQNRQKAGFSDILHDRAMLPTVGNLKWRDLRDRMRQDSRGLKSLRSLSTVIEEASSVHAWLVDTYQFFVTPDLLIDLILKTDLADKFFIDSVFRHVLPQLNPVRYSNDPKQIKINRKKVVQLSAYFANRFKKLQEPQFLQSLDPQQIEYYARAACKILEVLQNVLDCTVDAKRFDASERACIQWLVKMSSDSANWFHSLNIEDHTIQQIATTWKYQILGIVVLRISEFKDTNQCIDKAEVEFYNDILKKTWHDTEFQNIWIRNLEGQIAAAIDEQWYRTESSEKEFLKFYLETLKGLALEPSLEEILQRKADELVAAALSRQDSSAHTKWIMNLLGESSPRSLKALASTFKTEFAKFHDEKIYKDKFRFHVIKFLAESPFATRFYIAFAQASIKQQFAGKQYSNIRRVHEAAEEFVDAAPQKRITIEELKIILDNRQKMIEILDLVRRQKAGIKSPSAVQTTSDKEFVMLLENYGVELEGYMVEMAALDYFMNLCQSLTPGIQVNCAQLDEMHSRKYSTLLLKDLYKCSIDRNDLTKIVRTAVLKESVVFFPKAMEAARRFYSQLLPSQLDNSVWRAEWKSILNEVLDKAKDELIEVLDKVDTGKLPPENLVKEFHFTEGDEKKLRAEFSVLYKFQSSYTKKSKDAIHIDKAAARRARQVANVFVTQRNMETLDWFQTFRRRNDLKGDFAVIEKYQVSMLGLKEFEKLSGVLNIGRKKLDVLQAFSKQDTLLKWLQSEMKDESDVRGLCLVAVESTRHNPREADKWTLLSDCVATFDALIFHLDEISSVENLLEKCDNVWRKVDTDDGILNNWADVGKDIGWYKEHAQWYGSEDTTALNFAETVNKNGVFSVGKLKKSDSDTANLGNSLKLDISKKRDERVSREGSLSSLQTPASNTFPEKIGIDYLHEVESKLTLIASDSSDGKTEIEQFVAMLHAMESLANAYVDLVNAGFMLLSDWSAVIGSRKSKDTDIMAEHILTLQLTFQKGVRSLSKTVSIQDIHLLADIMRDALKRWNDHVSKMRLKHYFLNEYSIQQIKNLSGQLGKIRQSSLNEQAYLLLSDLPRSTMTTMIRESLNEAMTITEQEQEAVRDEEIPENDDDVSKEVAEIRKKRRAVRLLVNEENTSEALAKAAVEAEGYDDLTDCSNWITLYEYDTDIVKGLARQFDQTAGFVYEQADIREDVSILQRRSARTLEGMIQELQKKATEMGSDVLEAVKTIFVGYLNNTTALTMKDYLSVNHLGRFLTILHSKMKGKTQTPTRQLPKTFEKGRPNFIIAENRAMILLILSLYANTSAAASESSSATPPLPTSKEILICGNDTTADDVERFMRQAMCHNPSTAKLLFCLAFSENLNFNVSKALETIFEELSHDQHVSNDYQLVIMSSDQHHYVATCFDKYQVAKIPDYDVEKIHCYIKENMTKKTTLGMEKVRVVTSTRSGVGKSLCVKRETESLLTGRQATTLRLLEKDIDMGKVIDRLLQDQNSVEDPQLIHIDLTPAVRNGIEKFMFDLVISGMIKDSSGNVWRRHSDHSYLIEVTKQTRTTLSHTLELLPTVTCLTPVEVLTHIRNGTKDETMLLMDEKEYESDTFQRPYQYLLRHGKKESLSSFDFDKAKKDGSIQSSMSECIEILLCHCGIEDPSWAQLKHFVSFLDVQLRNCEKSAFCQMMDNELKGLKELAVKFMIRMAQDFATPSLVISDESGSDNTGRDQQENILEQHQVRRKWEENEHPYLFFNEDGVSMSFINVNIDKNGDLRDKDGNLVEERFTSKQLVRGLQAQEIQLGHNFHLLKRKEMLEKLCLIMGIDESHDPDETYELTTDNVLKMIAIFMRFRCNIPVIIMGETGCGKTRMIEFMSRLQAGKRKKGAKMKTLKVHGGIGVEDIFKSVREAADDKCRRNILFYDEANTTIAIYALKEVMCDHTIDGKPFELGDDAKDAKETPSLKLHIVAACNPYKKLSDEALAKFESSGLGYRVATSETSERFGNMAMRTLVYRVVALPPSIQPFVWDFGQLADETEKIYIEKMIYSTLQEKYGLSKGGCDMIVAVLFRAQTYMKQQKAECRYVSLRDVERTIKLYEWFQTHKAFLFAKMDELLESKRDYERQPHPKISTTLRCLLHAIGVSYHVSLENRADFRRAISDELFRRNYEISEVSLQREYIACQTAFHRDLKSEDNIAWNEALRENVFLMTVCADIKLPLYLIGKPGSSKSLAKTIVEANMKGGSSNSPLFKKLKKVEVMSYQCSALTQADGVKKIFKTAAERQKERDLEKFTSLVVLDEIGLAEDSPNMPLKILHPLLECGNADTGGLSEYRESEKVAFVGISNWALDPAKMNRGIFVTRNPPDENDLFETASSIFQGSYGKVNENYSLLRKLTKAYLGIYERQGDQFFGLRDYYSLIKMIRTMCGRNRQIDMQDIAYVLKRNFSGGSERHEKALVQTAVKILDLPDNFASQISLKKLVADGIESADNRFLLLLTAQHSSINLLEYILPDFEQTTQVIFGSSFPGDHTYTEICRNINRIKVCMEVGKRVVLLNMEEIHESLYDVLNQHYVRFGRKRYVAIGLGSHRVWSRVDEDFRMIVIEKRETVQNQYPIPLINRLEKHHLLTKNLLSSEQQIAARKLLKWSEKFASVGEFTTSSAFMGFHEDTASSVVLAYSEESMGTHERVLLQVATSDSLYRVPQTKHSKHARELMQIYMEEQTHDCLFSLLRNAKDNVYNKVEIFEVISFSNILTEDVRSEIERKLELPTSSVMLLSLQQFKIEQEYTAKLDDFFSRCLENPKQKGKEGSKNVAVLLIQTAKAHANGKLIECAKHIFKNKLKEFTVEKMSVRKMIVAFILSTERYVQANGNVPELAIQHTRDINAVYVDELRHSESNTSTTLISSFYKKSLGDILQEGESLLDKKNSTQSHVLYLLQDSISEAMSKVVSSESGCGRHKERIKLLRKICESTGTELEQVGHAFLKILLQKMDQFSQTQQQRQNHRLDWIAEEAHSQERLQEGGTFGKTVHLCLKRRLADMLAFVVSVIDENCNLNILVSPEKGMEWKLELWLQLFNSIALKEHATEQVEYTIKMVQHLNIDHFSEFPFSFRISREFRKFFQVSEQIENKETFFYNEVNKKKSVEIAKVLGAWNSSNCMKMMEAYAHDLLKFEFQAGANNQPELQTMTQILFQYAKTIWMEKGRSVNGVAVTFYTFKKITYQLTILSSIFQICPEVMKNVTSWIEKQQESLEFQIQAYALDDLMDWAFKKAGEIKDEVACIEWMNVSSQLKKAYKNLFFTIESDERKVEMQKKWKPLALLDMMLTHLLPWDKNDPNYVRYAGLIVVQAKRLFNAMVRKGFHSKEVLKIVTTIIRKSYEDLELSLIMQWRKPNCVCGRRIQIPIQMPCGGFICNTCAEMMEPQSPTCPLCAEPLPEGFQNTRANPSPTDLIHLKNFQASCTGFFLEYLNEYCFEIPLVPEDDIKIKAIFNDSFLPQDLRSPDTATTFTLETSKLDLNIAVKANIFQLLFKLRPSFVESVLDKALQGRFKDDTLIMAILKGFENICADNAPEEKLLVDTENQLRESWKYLIDNKDKLLTSQTLQNVARTRYALGTLVEYLEHERLSTGQNEMLPTLVLTTKELCRLENSDVFRTFITRTGAACHGCQWPGQILEVEQFMTFVNHTLLVRLDGNSPDYWEILGEDYEVMKSIARRGVKQAEFNQHFPTNTACVTLTNLAKILAILHGKNSTMLKMLQKRMAGINKKVFMKLDRLKQHFTSIPSLSPHDSSALYQLVVLTAGTVLCKAPMTAELHALMTNPQSTLKMFWPAMPESIYLSMNGAMDGEAPYSCPNGHVYYIGDCTFPWTMLQCPAPGCGATIGGFLHMAARGNQRLQTTEESQCGYQLQGTRLGVDNPSNRITEQAAAVIQFFVHSCMIVALKEKQAEILRMVGKGNEKEGFNFLANRLRSNLMELARGLGCNVDDSILVLHQILARMTKINDQNESCEGTLDWSSKAARKAWEKEFRLQYLLPVFQNADEFVVDAKWKLEQEDNLSRLLQDDATMQQRLTCFHPVLWRLMREPTASHLLHCIADSTLPGGVLRTILQTPNLHLVKHLGNALKLQGILIQRYHNKCDMKDVEIITFNQILKEEKVEILRMTEDYIKLWNAIFPLLLTMHRSNKVLAQYIKKIDINSPITMALPSAKGRGRCAKLLAEYIIDIQNGFLQSCKEADGSIDGITEIEVAKLNSSHFVCVNKRKDLLPMIHLHTAYSITTDEQGRQHHQVSYNIAALEKQAKESHVIYKKMIKKESLPCIKYAQDVGIGTDWDKVMANVKQIPLPISIEQEIDERVLTVTLADVCEGVRTLAQAISFLAKVKISEEEAERKLQDYLETDLMLSATHLAMVPKSATIRHTLALYQKLSCHKAVRFVQQGLDPYKECLQVEQQKLTDPEVLEKLKEAFQHMDLKSLQQHLNEMLIQVPEFEPWWSLVEIFAEVTFIEEDRGDSWYSRIPEVVRFGHVSDLFRLSVEGIRDIPE